MLQFLLQTVEPRGSGGLFGIGAQFAGGDEFGITVGYAQDPRPFQRTDGLRTVPL